MRPWKASGAASNENWCIAASSRHAPKPERPSLNGLKSFTTASGSTAPSVSNHLWTLKPTSTKNTRASCIHYLSTKSRQGQLKMLSGSEDVIELSSVLYPKV